MLFHAGAVWRFNQAELLSSIAAISSVSGGSYTAGVLAKKWSTLQEAHWSSSAYEKEIVRPLRKLAGSTVDIPVGASGVLEGWRAGNALAARLDRQLYGGTKLSELPAPTRLTGREAPLFIFNSTNLLSGARWEFTQEHMGDYRVGYAPSTGVRLAQAVAASSSFPPWLAPLKLKLKIPLSGGKDLAQPAFARHALLADGGVYDNFGIEAAWKNYRGVYVSDASPGPLPDASLWADWFHTGMRSFNVIYNQVGSLRKRQVIAGFVHKKTLDDARREAPWKRHGTYWSISSDPHRYHRPSNLPCPADQVARLAGIPTRLSAMSPAEQDALINWGYAIADTAIRTWIKEDLPQPAEFPYPSTALNTST
jgi:NTE family protein